MRSIGTLEVVMKLSRSCIRSCDFLTVVCSHSARLTVRRSNSAASNNVPCSTTGFFDSAAFCSSMMLFLHAWRTKLLKSFHSRNAARLRRGGGGGVVGWGPLRSPSQKEIQNTHISKKGDRKGPHP